MTDSETEWIKTLEYMIKTHFYLKLRTSRFPNLPGESDRLINMSSNHDEDDEAMDTEDSGQRHQAAPDRNADALRIGGSSVDHPPPPPIVSSQPLPLSANTVSPGWNQSGGGRMEINPGRNLASDDGPTSLTSMTSPSNPPTFPPTSVNSESQTDRPPQSPGTMPAAFHVPQSGGGRMEVNPGWNQNGGGRTEINPGWSHGSDNGPTSPSYLPTSPLTSVNSESQTDRPPQSPGTMPAAYNVSQNERLRLRLRIKNENPGWNYGSDNEPSDPPTSVNSESQTDRPPQSPGTITEAYNVQYYPRNPGWKQSGGGRMEVNPGWSHGSDNGPTSPSYLPTSPTSVNSESQTDMPPQSPGTMPAAYNVVEGTGRVRCLVDVLGWPQDEPALQKRQLEKALQSWFNRNETMSDTSCSIESLSDRRAEVIIQPASALECPLMSQDITLTVKDKTTLTIRFLPGAEILTPTPDSRSLEVHSPLLPSATQHVKNHEESQSTAAEPRRQETTPPQRGQDTEVSGQETKVSASFSQRGQEVSVPFPPRSQEVSVPFSLSPFVYLNQAYREEMKRIERDNGVTITTEVKVSFEVDENNKNNNGCSPNPERALAEFTTLAQKCLSNLDSVTVPLPRGAADQGDWRRVLQNVLREESRLVLSASCREMSLSGPSKSVADVRESLPRPQSTTSTNGSFSAAAARRDRPVEAQEIGMLRKDPSVPGGLPMHQSHWTAMSTTSARALANIKTKYSVSLEPEFSRGEVTVRVKAASGSNTVAANSLESHAFRALLRLYQKVVTSSTMGFSPQLPDQKAQKVADKIQQDTSALHPGVGVRDDHGSLGLPQTNLQGPAVDAVDRELGKPVFKDRDNKTKMGHTSHSDEQSARTAALAGGATAAGETKEPCPICLENHPQMEKLKCGHELCKDCKIKMVEISGPICPVCKDVFGKMQGNQPTGTMSWHSDRFSLPGFHQHGAITINYNIPNGTQTDKHPNPGKHYYGTQRTAYLPDNKEGREVVRLLKKAFDQKLIFTVGTSRTTGSEDQVTWNDIHHKTCINGGPQGFGYPDDNYLSRVRDELKDKGIK